MCTERQKLIVYRDFSVIELSRTYRGVTAQCVHGLNRRGKLSRIQRLYFVAFRRITGAADVISSRLQSPPVASWRRVAILLLLHWPHTTLPASKRA